MAQTVAVIVEYARGEARLPVFPDEPWFDRVQEDLSAHGDREKEAVLRVVAANKVPGQVLPRPEDVWLALLPFDDLVKRSSDYARDMLGMRMNFLELLVRLATSKRFGWQHGVYCGEDVGSLTHREEFWFMLLDKLSPDSKHDSSVDMGRNLTVLSRQQVPRFMLCLTQTVSSLDFPYLLNEFLSFSGTKDLGEVAAAGGLHAQDLRSLPQNQRDPVELGLRFTKGKFTEAIMAELLNVIQSTHRSANNDLTFSITTLHFGRLCTFQPKALELLCQRRRDLPSLQNIRLGSLNGVRPASLRMSLANLLRAPANLHRLATCTEENFAAFASALRHSESSSVEELDMVFVPTLETAKWLAFGLFHVDSHSKVSTLRLRIPYVDGNRDGFRLSTQWVEVFKRVIRSVRAEYDLADMEAEDTLDNLTNARIFVKLERPTSLKNDPYSGSRLVLKLDDNDDFQHEEFELIARAANHVAVVVPGFGIGWAPASSVVSERSVKSDLRKIYHSDHGSTYVPTNKRVKAFVWDMALPGCQAQQVWELLSLLEIIGMDLQRLDVPRMTLTTAALADLLMLCPNLTELNLSGHTLSSIQPLVYAYQFGRCQIAALSIAQQPSAYDIDRAHATGAIETVTIADEMVAILQAQANTTGPLRQLVIDSQPRPHHASVPAFFERELTPLLAALARCPRIDFTHLSQVPGHFLREATETATFCIHPLPLRHKLALTSVVDHAANVPMSRLDASVLVVIFRFSGDRVPRRLFAGGPLAFEQKDCTCNLCTMRSRINPTLGDERTTDMLPRIVW